LCEAANSNDYTHAKSQGRKESQSTTRSTFGYSLFPAALCFTSAT
jgi:hypothetical protein